MRQRILVCAVVCSAVLAADTLVLRNGKSVEGTYLGGDSRRVRIAVAESVESYTVDEISNIRFGSDTPAHAAAAPKQRREILRPEPPAVAEPARPAGRLEVPAGTSLVIRMIDDVDSERD